MKESFLNGETNFSEDYGQKYQSIMLCTNPLSWNRYVAFIESDNGVASCNLWWEDENDDRLFVLEGEPA